VLLCPNQYSTNLHNSLRKFSILVLVLSTAEPSCLLGYSGTTYNSSARTPQKTRVTYQTASSLVRYQHWEWHGRHRNTASSIVACWTVITKSLPGNALIKSVTIFSKSVQWLVYAGDVEIIARSQPSLKEVSLVQESAKRRMGLRIIIKKYNYKSEWKANCKYNYF
jgi:hypothetical protein